MKRIRKSILSFAAAASVTLMLQNAVSVSAATKDDVVAAARDAGFSEVYIQQGINYLEANPDYTSDDYDAMIGKIYDYAATADKAVDDYFQKNDPVVTQPPAQETQPPKSETQSGTVQNGATQNGAVQNGTVQNGSVNQNVTPEKDYASMTPEEKKDYIAGLSNQEKNQILKNLDKDKQLEIINGLIDASSSLGMNVTLDELSGDTLKYSIRNEEGKVVDSSAVGVIIDDTGINYTALILSSLAVILLSGSGLIILSIKQKKQKNNQN